MNSRAVKIVAIGVVASLTLVALMAQTALLGSMSPGSRIGDEALMLTPAMNAEMLGKDGSTSIKFDASRGAAAAQVRGLNIAARDVLAIRLTTGEVTGNVKLALGWLSTRNLSRPATASAPVMATAAPHRLVVLLSGHPRWRDNVTQIGLGFEKTAGSNAPAGAVVTVVELIPANFFGALNVLSIAWFGTESNLITLNESAHRVLPLALWLALICVASVAITALIFRRDAANRATALKTSAFALLLVAVVATVLGNRWPGWSMPIGAGVAAVIALLLIDPPRAVPLTFVQRIALALVAAGICVTLSPLVGAVALMPAVLLFLAILPASSKLPVISVGATLAAVPVLLIAAVSQGLIAAPALLTPLTDPTRALANVASGAGGLPGLALGMLAMHQLWPAPAQSRRWSGAAAVAAIWAVAGALLILAVPKIAVTAQGGSTYIALFFPALACLGLALLPKFREIAQSMAETQLVEAKTEADLSTAALALFESHAERVHTTLARRELGAAHAALRQMQRIAPAADATRIAELRVALADGNLAAADTAAAHLGASPELSASDRDSLLELAHRQHQPERVIELALQASLTEPNLRASAMAQLSVNGPSAAIAVLGDWLDDSRFARELAELHLLNDDVAATQNALMNSGISLTEPAGQAYIARLGMRVQGPELQAKGISSLATWHPQVGAIHAAHGELLQLQGNIVGARARLLLAMKLDPALWPLQYRLHSLPSPQEKMET